MEDIFSLLPESSDQLIKYIIFIGVFLFLISLIRSLLRVFMPIVVVGLVMVVFLGFSPDVILNKGKELYSTGKSLILENVLPFIGDYDSPPIESEEKDNKESILEEKSNDKLDENKNEFNTF